jgi:hypothetical protein
VLESTLATATAATVSTRSGERLHRTDDPVALAGLRESLAVSGVLDMTCMCMGDYRIDFTDGTGARVATIGYHHAATIRWDGFPNDAALRDGPAMLRWLAAQGVAGPLERHVAFARRMAAEQVESDRARRDWRAAAPVPDHVVDAILDANPPPADEILALVRAVHTTETATALALLAWCRSGTGLYSGYPIHEGLPGKLLAEIPIGTIVEALKRPEATDAHRAGAVRHLIAWRSRPRLERDIARVPVELRARLVEVAQRSDDRTTRERAAERLG